MILKHTYSDVVGDAMLLDLPVIFQGYILFFLDLGIHSMGGGRYPNPNYSSQDNVNQICVYHSSLTSHFSAGVEAKGGKKA